MTETGARLSHPARLPRWLFLDPIRHAIDTSGPLLEILWAGLLFAPFLTRIWDQGTKPRRSRAQNIPFPVMLAHISTAVVDLCLYYGALWRTGAAPTPNPLHFALCVVHSLSSLYLAAAVPRRNLAIVRATFQAMALQRLLVTGLAVYRMDPRWHKASVKLLHAFFWARYPVAGRLAGLDTAAKQFTASVVFCQLMALWEGDYPSGNAIYSAVLCALLAFDKWAQSMGKHRKRRMLATLEALGLITSQSPESSGEKKDE